MSVKSEASMSTSFEPVFPIDEETLFIDDKTAADIGKSFASQYQSGEPFLSLIHI